MTDEDLVTLFDEDMLARLHRAGVTREVLDAYWNRLKKQLGKAIDSLPRDRVRDEILQMLERRLKVLMRTMPCSRSAN